LCTYKNPRPGTEGQKITALSVPYCSWPDLGHAQVGTFLGLSIAYIIGNQYESLGLPRLHRSYVSPPLWIREFLCI